jgi:asparagine synthase (glutamine-hydrolysing)
MCGIAGFVTTRPAAPDHALLERITDTIRHRGPDESGFYQDDWASLGHRRLSIIDLATGQQPMSNEDGALWITYNGEIFNHAGLRPALEEAGHRYHTRCDTETILHAYEQYGPRCVELFRGMFAFAIWDKNARRLYCARDRLGKKPFYYYWDGRLFAFASEIKALLKHPAISPRFEDALLAEYLAFGYVSEERTLFSGIRKLMPGHYLTLDVSGEGLASNAPRFETRPYWEIPAAAEPEERPDAEWIRECRERLEETVRMRLMSDVPLGMFLSGGVDSSAIAALMKRMFTGPVKTFAVGYREAEYSELSYARRVAERIGTEHHEVSIGMEDFFHALPKLIWHEDEPIVWPSSVSLYFVSKLASEQVKVVLTGEGSDELFAGYARYHFYEWNARWLKRYRLVPAALRRAVRAMIASSPLLSAGARRKLQHTFLGLGEDLESLYLDNFYSAFPASEQAALFPQLRSGSPYGNFARYWDQRPDAAPLARMLFADQKTYLVELLMKQDQMSMATSIESRVPFLDHEFVEFSTRVPEHLKLRGSVGKYIVKKAVEDLLPADIIYRKKMGFPTPLRQWLLDPRADRIFEMLTGGLLAEYIDGERLRALIERQRARGLDATDRIWRLVNLQIWGDLFLTGEGRRWEDLLRPAHATV